MNKKRFLIIIVLLVIGLPIFAGYDALLPSNSVLFTAAANPLGDTDGDGILDDGDQSGIFFDNPCTGGETTNCDDNCPHLYNPNQADLNNNGIGDPCECEADFEGDGDVDAFDVDIFLQDFGRNNWYRPCHPAEACNGDFDNDGDVDAIDLALLIEDYGRNKWINPCPPCFFGLLDIQPPPPPPPGPRFIDHGDGTVTDTTSGLMWTKDAQLIPWKYQWETALTLCDELIYPEAGGYDDWHLPSTEEFTTLIDYYSNTSPPLPPGHPFFNVLPFLYWTSDHYSPIYRHVVYVSMVSGHFFYHCENAWGYVWPVRNTIP